MGLRIKIGKVTFPNPVWVASGTFGSGEEFQDFLDLGTIGAVITKTVTLKAREGNPPPRIVETPSGLLNSIGLENKGIDHFRKEVYPVLRELKTKIIISIAGADKKEILKCAGRLLEEEPPDAIEVNLSCPNVTQKATGYRLISQDPRATERIVSSLRRETTCALIAKLTPDVTDVAAIARAAEAGGADAVSLVNTYPGMAVDAEDMKPVLGNVIGGLSGPAIKPLALKAVRDVYNSVNVPVIGIGGIMTGTDVAEFMLCGARAVQVGTANLADPGAYTRILAEFKLYLKRKKIDKAGALTGRLKT
ncbi:MAG: dihydroorotate dehydrogenase [Candidatus Makaraimicrobium thalassicum]|nr:MAG: dihydroorotate dehydrogenase [Candidatus Omnitrophota bacterium]